MTQDKGFNVNVNTSAFIGMTVKYSRVLTATAKYPSSSFGIVGIITEDNSCAYTNTIEGLDYYGADEDVAVFKLEERPEDQIESLLQDTKMIEAPINRMI